MEVIAVEIGTEGVGRDDQVVAGVRSQAINNQHKRDKPDIRQIFI
jgi:hypothetical protein